MKKKMEPEWVIVGLGNPGPGYARHRHNIGFRCADAIAKRYQVPFSRKGKSAQIGEGSIEDIPTLIVKPLTYVNLSGKAVADVLRVHKIAASNLLVIYDDMDLPLGQIRIKERGSAGGHNGMKSIIGCLGTDEFLRLRIGIDRPAQGGGAIGHVLNTFSVEERPVVQESVERVSEAVLCVLTLGIAVAMNRFN